MKKISKTAAAIASVSLFAGIALAKDPNKIVVEGSTTVGPIAKVFREYYIGKHPDVNITVGESGSGNGAKALINAVCDIATMSRPMKKSEKNAAEDGGVLPIEHVVAKDGIAMIVHPSNPVGALTVDQVRRIYTGAIRNWKELGGPNKPIVAISRDTNSGTYETFETKVMNKEKITGSVEYVNSNGAARQRVMNTEAAVAYVGLAFTTEVKALKINGIEATPENVLNDSYPIARPLFMYTNGRPKEGTPLRDFIGLSQTPQGKKMIEDTGFVPLE